MLSTPGGHWVLAGNARAVSEELLSVEGFWSRT
jgi:hypothetical protein